MKLSLTLLARCLDLPTKDAAELRRLFDDLGLGDFLGDIGQEVTQARSGDGGDREYF